MKSFFVRQRRLVVTFTILVVWLVGFYAWINETFTAPLDEPIALSSAGTVERDIRLRLDAPHRLQIVFAVGTRPREEAMQLIGDKSSCQEKRPAKLCDIAVPLQWSIINPSGQVVAAGETETHGIIGWTADEIYRVAASPIRLPVGRYRFNASVLRNVSEFDGITARLSLALPGSKVSFGWQSDLAFFGGYLNFFLILPITVIFGIALIVRLSDDRVQGQRKS